MYFLTHRIRFTHSDEEPRDVFRIDGVIFPDDRVADIVQIQRAHQVQTCTTTAGFHPVFSTFHIFIQPGKKNIIISFHKIDREVVEILPDVYVVRKDAPLDIIEKIITDKSGLFRRKHKDILSINDICLLRSFTNGMSIHTLVMITGHTTKQIYFERKKIMNRFQLTKALLQLLASVIIAAFSVDFPYRLNRDQTLVPENSHQ